MQPLYHDEIISSCKRGRILALSLSYTIILTFRYVKETIFLTFLSSLSPSCHFHAVFLKMKGRYFIMEILRTDDLCKTYGSGNTQVTAVNHVSLTLQKGEYVAIVGASGSGKSTLLHMLGGVDRPTGGSIFIEDTDIATLSEEQLAIFRRRKVGLIYQFYNLIPTLNIKKNILLPMLLDDRKPQPELFDEIVATLGLQDRLTHLPGELSGGEQQRAAIARSLIYRPAILLADEPTGNLDRKNAREISELIRLSNKRFHQTILLITHDEKLAMEADRVVTMEDGRIASDKAVLR